jgi:hypothetical protein
MFVSEVRDMSNTPGNKSNSVDFDQHHAVIQEQDADNNDDDEDDQEDDEDDQEDDEDDINDDEDDINDDDEDELDEQDEQYDEEDDEEPGFWDDHGHARLERRRRLAMSGSVKAQEAKRYVKRAKTIQQEVYIYPNDRPLTNSEIFQAFLGIPMSDYDKAQAALLSKIHCE